MFHFLIKHRVLHQVFNLDKILKKPKVTTLCFGKKCNKIGFQVKKSNFRTILIKDDLVYKFKIITFFSKKHKKFIPKRRNSCPKLGGGGCGPNNYSTVQKLRRQKYENHIYIFRLS